MLVQADMYTALLMAQAMVLQAMAALLVVHLTAFKVARRSGVSSTLATCVLGGILGIVPFVAAVVLFSGPGESFPGLLRFWVRVPGELVGGALPFVVSGAVFGAEAGGVESDRRGGRTRR